MSSKLRKGDKVLLNFIPRPTPMEAKEKIIMMMMTIMLR